jgi:mannose/fructose/N-acetylgalactosamine-specific phosphotransferase system component IID
VGPLLLIGGGLGLTLTPRNVAAMGAVSKDRTGQAAGILSSVTAIASILGVAVSGTLFEESRNCRLPHLLAAHGPHLSHDSILRLERAPGGTPTAQQEVARFGTAAPRVADAAREAFTYSIAVTVVLSTAVVIIGLALVAVVMRRRLEPVAGEAPAPA